MKFDKPAGPNPIDRQRVVGQPHDRIDGAIKTTGRAPYAYERHDVAPGQAYGYIVGSGIAKGRINRIDSADAKAAPGVLAVVTALDMPKLTKGDYNTASLFGGPLVQHYHQAVAIVVAESFEQARAAAGMIQIDYARQKGRFDLAHEAKTAPLTAGDLGDGTKGPKIARVGDFDGAFKAAPVQLDQTYTTPDESHAMMEPHATIASWSGDKLTVWTSNQMVAWGRGDVAKTLGIAKEKVRLDSPYIGGGFGGKLFVRSDAILAALGAKAAKRPVKVALQRPLVINNTKGREVGLPLLRDIAEQGSEIRERQWGYVGWSTTLSVLARYDEAVLRARQGIALDPAFGKIYANLGEAYLNSGRIEPMILASRESLERVRTPEQSQLSAIGFGHMRDSSNVYIDEALRDDEDLLAALQHQGTLPEYNGNARTARMSTLIALARLGEFRRAAASLPLLPFSDPAFAAQASGIVVEFAAETGRTGKAVAMMDRALTAAAKQIPKGMALADVVPTVAARYAELLIASGRTADAAKAVGPTRLDCYPCLVARGEVAAAQRDLPAATRWFVEAARQGPSLPQADYQWGRMLAANHDRPAALAHFAIAAKRAPGWYEPPYASGRILMAMNRFADARAALEQAHAAAPKRADVMLALGRAQWLGRDRAKAKATWAAARKLDLLEPELAWLKVIDAAVKRAS